MSFEGGGEYRGVQSKFVLGGRLPPNFQLLKTCVDSESRLYFISKLVLVSKSYYKCPFSTVYDPLREVFHPQTQNTSRSTPSLRLPLDMSFGGGRKHRNAEFEFLFGEERLPLGFEIIKTSTEHQKSTDSIDFLSI